MNKLQYIFLLLPMLFLIFACEEVGPEINFETEVTTPQDTTTNNEVQRTVLLEEFTGVRCANCPAGAELAQQLANESGGRVVIISIHSSGAFAIPYSGEVDFRTSQGDKIENLLGKASGYPSATINRNLFDGEQTPIVTSTSWSKHITNQLEEAPTVDIELTATLNNGIIEVNCALNILKDIAEDVKLSVVVVEDEIVSPQNVNSVKVDDYVHQHVFRTMLTPFDGELLTTGVLAGDQLNKSYQLTEISTTWNTNKLSVIAYVHGNNLSGVYQVAKAKL